MTLSGQDHRLDLPIRGAVGSEYLVPDVALPDHATILPADDGSGDNRKHLGDDYLGEEETRNLRGKLLRVVLALGGPSKHIGQVSRKD
jgi:hypothetical protein